MGTRTITECDRCKHEAKFATQVDVGSKSIDLCEGCKAKLDRFLSGEDLEVPP